MAALRFSCLRAASVREGNDDNDVSAERLEFGHELWAPDGSGMGTSRHCSTLGGPGSRNWISLMVDAFLKGGALFLWALVHPLSSAGSGPAPDTHASAAPQYSRGPHSEQRRRLRASLPQRMLQRKCLYLHAGIEDTPCRRIGRCVTVT
jgi:hypothetical protein